MAGTAMARRSRVALAGGTCRAQARRYGSGGLIDGTRVKPFKNVTFGTLHSDLVACMLAVYGSRL